MTIESILETGFQKLPLFIIKIEARINFKPEGYNYPPLKLKAQILSNSLFINHKTKEGQTHPSLQGTLRRKAPQFTS